MKVRETALAGMLIIEPEIFTDQRGYFFESYNKSKYAAAGIDIDFIQDNHSFSHKGVIRGLHAQAGPTPQAKLIRVIQGSILDVAVDIRKNSPTYGSYEVVELSAQNQLQVLIPHGCLHGFSVFEKDAIVAFKVDNYHDKNHVVGVRWNDPTLNIDWRLAPGEAILSAVDMELPLFKDLESPFMI